MAKVYTLHSGDPLTRLPPHGAFRVCKLAGPKDAKLVDVKSGRFSPEAEATLIGEFLDRDSAVGHFELVGKTDKAPAVVFGVDGAVLASRGV